MLMKYLPYRYCKFQVLTVGHFYEDGGSWWGNWTARRGCRSFGVAIYSSADPTGSNNEAIIQKFYYGQQFNETILLSPREAPRKIYWQLRSFYTGRFLNCACKDHAWCTKCRTLVLWVILMSGLYVVSIWRDPTPMLWKNFRYGIYQSLQVRKKP